MFKFGSMNTAILKVALSSAISIFGIASTYGIARAQLQLPDVVPGEIVNSIKGTSLTRTVSSGGQSSLSFGSNTTFGTSASVNATSGTKVESISNLKFDNATLTTRLGGDTDRVTAEIGNIRANDLGSHSASSGDTTVDSLSNAYSNGNADISGIYQANELELNGAESAFTTKASTVHGDSAIFEEITAENQSGEAQTASGSSAAMLSTNTQVDINTSEFVNSFQQAY